MPRKPLLNAKGERVCKRCARIVEGDNEYTAPSGYVSCKFCRAANSVKHTTKVEAAETSTPASKAAPVPAPRRKRASADEVAADLATLALSELESLLSSPIATRRHQAAVAILARAKEATDANKAVTPEALAEIERRVEALRRVTNDPTWLWSYLTIAIEAGIVPPPPEGWLAPVPKPVAELAPPETATPLIDDAPIPPVDVEDAVIVREVCLCGCVAEAHEAPEGADDEAPRGQCRNCIRCHLYSPISTAMAVRESHQT